MTANNSKKRNLCKFVKRKRGRRREKKKIKKKGKEEKQYGKKN
jgi:hypothetical protein